jgi:hypothetical protein
VQREREKTKAVKGMVHYSSPSSCDVVQNRQQHRAREPMMMTMMMMMMMMMEKKKKNEIR